MKTKTLIIAAICCICSFMASAGNPYLPLWEFIPDGEPYVFEDPDNPGQYRVYIYGSHDTEIRGYCGRDQVVWSASVDDLTEWRYDGVIFESRFDADGNYLNEDKRADVLFAPDVAEVVDKDGKKTYYLYPNTQAGGRNNMVAKSDRPDGPFKVCNWDPEDPRRTVGMFGFDPAAFVDDDGRAYGYWGYETSYATELDPVTMCTPKEGAPIIKDLISGKFQEGEFRFFEASSMRKVEDKYVLVYSRWTADGDFGLPETNYTLAYAYSDSPLGPFTYGGTIIDGRGRDTDQKGNTTVTATSDGNTHGSILKIKDQWYVFYHRQCGTDEYSRQAMVAPISVSVEGDKVVISEGEYTSEGFEINGMNPYERYSAGIACHYTGPRPATSKYPHKIFSGSYPAPHRINIDMSDAAAVRAAQDDITVNTNPVVNNTDGSVVGYKYFNFDGAKPAVLSVNLTPEGIEGVMDIYIDSPWESKGGRKIGSIRISEKLPAVKLDMEAILKDMSRYNGKHAVYFVFSSDVKDESICTLHDFVFEKPVAAEENNVIAGVETGTKKGRFQYGAAFRTGKASQVTTETAVVLSAGYRLKRDYFGINVGYGVGSTFYERDCGRTYGFDGIPVTLDYIHYCLLGKAKKHSIYVGAEYGCFHSSDTVEAQCSYEKIDMGSSILMVRQVLTSSSTSVSI